MKFRKYLILVSIVAVATVFTVGCGSRKSTPSIIMPTDEPKPGTIAYGYFGEDSLGAAFVDDADETLFTEVPEITRATDPEKLTGEDATRAKYLDCLLPADDEFDYKWANDYSETSLLNYYYVRDAKGYSRIFDFDKPTKEQLHERIDKNKNISNTYKEILKEYVDKWLELWPESDFSVLYHNLKTLKIEEMTTSQIQIKAASIGTVACYIGKDNLICINKDADVLDRNSSDYVVLLHEVTHAARTCKDKDIDGKDVHIGFFQLLEFGLYEDEAFDTYFVYQLQGLNERSKYYCLQSSIYRQLLPTIDYDGADYMNHSVNFFIERLQDRIDELGLTKPAYYYVCLIDSQATLHYQESRGADYTDFSDLYELLVRNYIDIHGSADMSPEASEKLFEEFFEDISFNLENLRNPYTEINYENLKSYWDKVVSEQGN